MFVNDVTELERALENIDFKLCLLKFTQDDTPRNPRKERVEGGRVIAKSPGATDW